MRQLKPGVAEERKRKVLQWAVHRYVRTSSPIASAALADGAGLGLSSATIRSILKELEDEGFLHQPYASSGRVPTDRGYRQFVDYLVDVQRLASDEKQQLERQYTRRVEELDGLLSQTSKLLSSVSRSAGLVLSPKLDQQVLKRLELILMGGHDVLAILVTKAGQVRHWPIRLSFVPSGSRIEVLNRFLNDHVEGKSIREVQQTLASAIEAAERELREMHGLAERLLGEIDRAPPEDLFMDGATALVSRREDFSDLGEIESLIRVMEERRNLARVLDDEFERLAAPRLEPEPGSLVRVRIGGENALPELKNLSLVTRAYHLNDQVVGVLGILGPKRMEYARMISLVDFMGNLVSRALAAWDGAARPSASPGAARETGRAAGPAAPRPRRSGKP